MPEERIDDHSKTQLDNEKDNEEHDIEMISSRKKALVEFRCRIEDAILGNYLLTTNKKSNTRTESNNNLSKEITLWGIPLLPSAHHEGTNIVLTKFLKAKDYKVHEAFMQLRKTLKWREEFKVDKTLEEDFGFEAENLWFSNGVDKEGRPLCYNVLGKKSLEKSILGEKGNSYLRWRVQCVEKGIQNLNFRAGGVDSIVQIVDLGNSPGPATKEVRFLCKKMINMLHQYYPGIVYKNLIVNVPAWFWTLHALNLRLITQRTKSKFMFLKASRVAENILKYVTPENVLVQYGGLKRDNDNEFSTQDKVLELNIRANCTETIRIPINEVEVTVTWDVSVVGHEVTYKEEFIPDDDCSYNILLQDEKKMGESTRNTFSIREPGKIVLTIVNSSFTKKKVFYRYKSRPSVPLYMFR